MQTTELKISAQNAQAAFVKGTAKQKAFLKDLFPDHNFDGSIMDRVKSYPDACLVLGIKTLTIADFSALPGADQEYHFASHMLVTIAKALNEGWTADFADHSQYKYYPYFFHAAGGSGFSFHASYCDDSNSYVGSRLVFRTSELATYAGKQFIDLYNITLQN